MSIENIGLVAVTENAAKQVAVKAGGKIKAAAGTKYLLQVENSDVAPQNVTIKRAGKDLQVFFEGSEQPDLTIEDFFAEGMDSQLYGVAEDGQLYAYVRTDGEGFGNGLLMDDGEMAPIALGGESLGDGAAYLSSGFVDAAGWGLWSVLGALAGLAALAAGTAAIIDHNRDKGKKKTSPQPTGMKVIDDVGPIQGELHNGDITDDSHPEISGNGVPGAIIHIFDNGQEIGSTTVNPDGTWSYTPELADGAHSIDITQEVPGQKPSAPIKVIDFTVDTIPPAAPTAEIEGAKTDGEHTYSNDDKPTIHGNGEPGDTIIVIFPTGESVTTIVAEDGTWVAPAPTQPLPEGDNEIKVIEQDPAGNQTEIVIPVIIDTIAPDAPEVHLNPDSDSGIKGDDITSETKPTIDGKTEPGAEITVVFPTGESITVKADENGDWSVTPTQPLPEGNNDITVIATDPAGNASEPTVISVVIDTTAPVAPMAELDPASDSGVKGDDITNVVKPTIDGKTEPGAEVTVIFPTGESVTTIADADGNWHVTPTEALPEGLNDITVIATDAAGNASEPTTITVEIDTTAPDAPQAWLDEASDSGIKGDNITNETKPTIDGITEPGAEVTVTFPTGEVVTTTADAEGNWHVTPTQELPEGLNDISVIATDAAGNASEPTHVVVEIDTTAPDADKLAITGVEDNVGLITGNIENGGSTDDSHPTISGTGTAGDTIVVFTKDVTGENHPIGSTTVDADGNWKLTPELPLNSGVNELTAVESDAAGNATTSKPYEIILDMGKPNAPTIESVYDDVGPYQGFLQKGAVTDDNKPTIAGTAQAGSTVKLYDGNHALIGSVVADEHGNWSITPETALADGKHEVYATATSPVGVVSEPTGLWPFIVDTSAPDNVKNLEITDDVGPVTGPLHDGSTTDDNHPTFSGDAEPDSTVIIYDNGEKIGEADVGPDGKWEFTPTDPLADGEHAFTTEVVDEAGNSSGQNDPVHVIVDTTGLGVNITHVIDHEGSITGDIKFNGVTDDTRPEIQGTSKPGSIVKVFDGKVELGSVTADAKGNWSFTPEKDLAEGAHEIIAIATDKAGKVSDPSKFAFTIDFTAPNQPTIDGVYDDVGSIQGPIENGGVTDDPTPTIAGQAEAGSTVTVYDNGEKMGSVVADADGKWEYTPTTPISEGTHDFTVEATDKAGNTSVPSEPYTVITDYTAPDVPTITGVEDNVGEITGNIPNGGKTDDSRPVISGEGTAGDTITVYANDPISGNHPIGSTTVGEDGKWSLLPEVPLNVGLNDLTAVETDPAGNSTVPSAPYSFTLDTAEPGVPVIVNIFDDVGPYTGFLQKGDVTDDSHPTINGTAEAGSLVKLYDNNSVLIGSAIANAEGNWSITPEAALADGKHEVYATATNDIGVVSQPTGKWDFIVDTGAPDNVTNLIVIDDVGPKTGQLFDGDTTDDNRPTFSGDAEPNGKVIIYDNGEKIGEAPVDADGKWTFEPTQPLTDGEHDFATEVLDKAGNSSGPSDPMHVVVDTSGVGVTITHVIDDVGSIRGDIAPNGVTDDKRPEIQGTSKPGSVVKLFDGSVSLGSTTADSKGNWSFTPVKDLAEGPHNISAIATDKAGVVSLPSKFAFTVDTVAPNKPTIDQVYDDVGSIQGPIANGGVTDDSTPTISGKAEAGSTVVVYDNGQKMGSVVADADGKWSYTPTTPISEGQHDFTADATDKAGNTSPKSDIFTIITDYTPPDADKLAITGVEDNVGTITGNVEKGGTTDDPRPVIHGTGTAGDVVTVYDKDSTGNHVIGSTTVDANGNWSLKPATPINLGLNELTAVETDPAGNATKPSAPYDFTFDPTAPQAPVIVSIFDDVGPYQGFLQKGDVTDDNKPTIAGTAQAGSVVRLYDNNNALIGSTTADSKGNWEFTPATALADGKHEVFATATNAVGVVSEPTGKWDFIVDTSAPSNVTDLIVTDNVGAVTGPLHNGDTTDDNRPTFSGGAEPNGKVVIYDNGAKIGEAPVDANGKWEFKPTTPFTDGPHDFTTEVLDKAGNTSGQGDKLNVIVDTSGVGVQITHVIDSVGSIQGDIAPNGFTDDTRPEIQGTSKAGSTVKLYDGNVLLGSTTVDSKGNWSFKPSSGLADGAHTIKAIATDKAGVVSTPALFDFTVDTKAPVKPTIDQVWDDVGSIQGPIENGGVTDDSTPTLSGKAEAGSTVVIYDNSQKMGSTTAGADGKWNYTPTSPISEGKHDFTVDATDKAGNTSPKSDVFTIITDYHGPDSNSTQLSIDNVTSDNTVNNSESRGNVTISGKVTGEFSAGDKVSFKLAGTDYSATVGADGKWSVDVPGSKLVDETAHKIDATLIAHDKAGNAGTITASHGYNVMLNSVSISSMSKDTAMDLAHASDFVTADGSAGRGVYGKVEQALSTGQKVQVSVDGGATWKDAATNGLNWTFVDTSAHAANWTIQARIVENGVTQTEASKAVSYVTAGGAPTITSIPGSDETYTDAKAATGKDVNVSLAGTNAKAGDTLHIIWGDTTYDQVLTAADIAAGTATAKVPAQQTSTQGGKWDFGVTAQIVTVEGQMSAPSNAIQFHGQGWTTLAIDDLNRNVTSMEGSAGTSTIYQGGGVTITSNTTLQHWNGDSASNKGLQFGNGQVNGEDNYAQIHFTTAVSDFSLRISGLENQQGGSRVVIFDTKGNILYDQKVTSDGTGGTTHSKLFSYTAPVGTDIGKVTVYGDGVNADGNPGGGIVLDTLKFHQVHHASGFNDTFTDIAIDTTGSTYKSVTGAASYYSAEGHYTLTKVGTMTPTNGGGWFNQQQMDGAYLYIGTGDSAINNSAAIFTFDQPVQSFGYNLWGLETTAGNYSKVEVYDTDGKLIFTRNVTNNGGSVWNYEQVSYTAPEGISIGQVKVYQDQNGTLLDNFYTVLAPDAPSGQKLIDHNWETFFDEASTTNAVVWHGQSFGTTAYSDKSSLANFHSDSGAFTITGNALKQASGSVWQNATAGSMYVDNNKTAVVTFDSGRSKIEVGATGIERGNVAVLKVFDTSGKLLTTIDMTNPNGQYDIQTYSYEAVGNQIGRIEVTGEGGGTHIMSISSSVTQVTTENDVVSMVVDPVAYFAQESAHVFGSSGMDTLKLTGANQVLDLRSLTGDSGAAKISSIEKFDITGTGNNTLKISLNDVLHLGETDMFRKDGKVQVMVDGNAGDKVELYNLHDHGTAPGTWQSAGTATIGGSVYQVYNYSSLDAEVLIKQAVTGTIV